jgi:hypothetical protein
MLPFFRVLLPVLFLMTQLFALDEELIGVMVKVRSEFQNFNKRFEVHFKDELSKDSMFDLMSNRRFGSHRAIVNIDVKYPVHAFPKQETFYVKLTGLPEGVRYMCFSIPAQGKGKLNLRQETKIANEVIQKVLSQIKREFKQGPYLEPGYFNNKYNVSLESKLVVELIGEKVSPRQKSKLQDLDEPLVSSKIVKEEVTIKQEETQRALAVKEKKSEKAPVQKKSEKVKDLKSELKMTWSGKRRSLLLRQLALIYKEEDLRDDALAYALKAYEDDPTEENFKLLRELETNDTYGVDRFRFNNRVRNLDMSLILKTEYDSNAIQDAVDSLIHRDSDDILIQAAFLMDKKWGWKLGSMEQYSSYDVSQSFYAEEQDLDLMTHRIGHDMSYLFDHARMNFGIGYNYFLRRGKSLLDGADLNWSLSYYVDNYDQVWNVSLFWMDKNYSDHFYSSDLRNGRQYRLNLSWQASLSEGHQFVFNTGSYEDDLKDPTLSYEAYLCSAQWNIDVNHVLLDRISPSFYYERRTHEQGEPGRNPRKDAQFSYGIQATKVLKAHHSLNMNMLYTDNQSSRRVSRYKRTQVSLGYQIDF